MKSIPLKDILIHPDIERFTVLPAGGRMDNSTEIISSNRMENLIREIKNRYPDRYIIFDSPALSTCSDPIVLSAYADAIESRAKDRASSGTRSGG